MGSGEGIHSGFTLWVGDQLTVVGVIVLAKDPHGGKGSGCLTRRFTGKTGRTKRRIFIFSYMGRGIKKYLTYSFYKVGNPYSRGSSFAGVLQPRLRATSVVMLISPVCCCKLSSRLGTIVSQFCTLGKDVQGGGDTLLVTVTSVGRTATSSIMSCCRTLKGCLN